LVPELAPLIEEFLAGARRGQALAAHAGGLSYDLVGVAAESPRKPKLPQTAPQSIRDENPVEILLATAASADASAKAPKRWPKRDVALVATFCAAGIRPAEAIGLNLNSITGPAGARRLQVTVKATRTAQSRSSPRSRRCSTATSNRGSSAMVTSPSRTRPRPVRPLTTGRG